jgi:hypothetical protein
MLRPFLGAAFAHVEAIATETRYLLARFAIRRGDAKATRHEIAPLRRMKAPYVRAFVRLVLAGADVLDGRSDAAREAIGGAIADAEACRMTGFAALSRRRLAEVQGTPTDEADAALAAHSVVDVERFARVFATWPKS